MVTTMNEVTSQLLKYSYQRSEGKGVAGAIQVARQWVEEIFKKPWWPPETARPLVHYGESMSCDAIKLTYQANDANNALIVTVFQTIFLIVVTVAPGSAGKLSVLDVARRLFNYSERLNLTIGSRETTGAAGHQVSRGVTYRECDWLDTIRWWSSEELVGFEMLKRTGPAQSTIVRPELGSNRTWFARLE
jgi:hypothetical protein